MFPTAARLALSLALIAWDVPVLPIDDFESAPKGWKFVGGEEFPGARGSLALDPARGHGGQSSYRLEADFRGGGAYVGVWKDLDGLELPDVEGFRVWVWAKGVGRLGVRLVDSSAQCHQGSVALPSPGPDGWSAVDLKVRDLVGGEHWGGVNDGLWHGPPKGLGLNVGKDSVDKADAKATLWFDDLVALPIAPGKPTLRACSIAPTACRPGFGTRISYSWDAEPLGSNCNVFVHFVDPKRGMVFQADSEPPRPTSRWSGRVDYARSTVVPVDVPPGRYDVVVGLWDGRPSDKGGGRRPFLVGEGIVPLPDDAARVGTLEISADAPLPVLPPPSLNLGGYKLTFDEGFDGPLSVSAWGPGTRWIAHTPYGGDFGDAGFADPRPGFPFATRDGLLRIEAKKVEQRWQSGLICSVDPKGQGFSQKFGYFEMRAKLPKGLGTWPAFWLMGVPQLVEPKDRKTIPQIEIDVVEQYGVGPNALHTTLHLWGPGTYHWAEGDTSIVAGMSDDDRFFLARQSRGADRRPRRRAGRQVLYPLAARRRHRAMRAQIRRGGGRGRGRRHGRSQAGDRRRGRRRALPPARPPAGDGRALRGRARRTRTPHQAVRLAGKGFARPLATHVASGAFTPTTKTGLAASGGRPRPVTRPARCDQPSGGQCHRGAVRDPGSRQIQLFRLCSSTDDVGSRMNGTLVQDGLPSARVRRAWVASGWLTVLGFGVAFGLLFAGCLAGYSAREDAWRLAEQQSNNLRLALRRDIERNIALFDLSLQGVIEALAEPGIDRIPRNIRQHTLFDSSTGAEDLGSIVVLDKEGDVVESSIPVPHGLNFGARDEFAVHRQQPNVGLFLSRASRSWFDDDRPSMSISRRLPAQDGHFAGVVTGALRLSFFQHLFAQIDIGPKGSITLLRDDGHIVWRYPLHAGDIDRDLANTDSMHRMLSAAEGQFVARSSVDGVSRLYCFGQVGHLPLILSVNLATDDIYAQWRAKALIIGPVLLVICAAIVALSLLFGREMLRRAAAEQALTEAAHNLSLMAATDALTGLANRRTFEDVLDREWRRALREQADISLLMVDADHFKSFNDLYGHQEGDRTLRLLASAIQGSLMRPADLAARYGGEEFVVLLPGCSALGASLIAERVRAAVEALAIPHAGNATSHVTASLGVATMVPGAGKRAAGLVKAADDELYAAKRNGRNTVSAARSVATRDPAASDAQSPFGVPDRPRLTA